MELNRRENVDLERRDVVDLERRDVVDLEASMADSVLRLRLRCRLRLRLLLILLLRPLLLLLRSRGPRQNRLPQGKRIAKNAPTKYSSEELFENQSSAKSLNFLLLLSEHI